MVQNAKFVKNLILELKNANPNSRNVIINNLHPKILLYFQKYWKLNELNDFLVYFRVDNP